MRSRVRPADILRVGAIGLNARKARALLSALSIAVSIAALVAVLGIAASAKAALLSELGQQGNLLTVAAGRTFSGTAAPLPVTAEQMIAAIPPVREVAAIANLGHATVRRSAAVPAIETGGITVMAAQPSLLTTLTASVLTGHFLDEIASRYPEVVLGYTAAETLGIDHLNESTMVYISGHYVVVVGILRPVELAPEIDSAALVSFDIATSTLGAASNGPTRIYLRSDPDQVSAVASVLPFTASPQQPEAVEVRRPSDILNARLSAKTTFVGLFLALGSVALLVGGVSIANIMVISVLERRAEIGLRRALGARARHIATQFLTEAVALSAAGGVAGVALGSAATLVADQISHNQVALPLDVPLAGLASAIVVGLLAGVYPATRAARIAPARALRTYT